MADKTVLKNKLHEVAALKTCEQCGYCSSACPITGKDGYNVRRLLKYIELDMIDDIAATSWAWLCATCGRCENACPNGVPILDLVRPLRFMAPVDRIPQGPPPCTRACPAGIDVPGYVRFIAQGEPQKAYALIMEKMPFPGILGRICTHPCETQCRRKDVNQAVSICALKRYAADKAAGGLPSACQAGPDSGKKVAVIGSGPAGLSAAYFLRRKGHAVTVFEGRTQPGGMMRYGIPAYRLPRSVLDDEISRVLSLGVELKTNTVLGRDFDLGQLKRNNFEAFFLALGLQRSRKITLEGAELDGVLWGVDFLGQVSEGQPPALKERVMVIGGGNVAVDVALTSLRLGAKEVFLACLERRSEMPASSWELEMALEEGVKLLPSQGPGRLLGNNGRVTGIELVACASVFNSLGEFAPTFADTRQSLPVDQVIFAVGQTSDLACLSANNTCRTNGYLIAVDEATQATDQEGVFAGGDVTHGPGSVIQSIAAGKRAASAIDRYLGGDGLLEESGAGLNGQPYSGKREQGFADLQRVPAPRLPLTARQATFSEIELCLEDVEARQEASRCLQCDLELRYADQY